MNRRQAIRKVVGVGAAVAALPVLGQAQGSGNNAACGLPCGSAPEWKEPPLDLRTPEQIVEDSEEDWAKNILIEASGDYTKYRHHAYHLPNRIFARVERLLAEQHIPFERRDIAGRPSLIINGNVYQQEHLILSLSY